MQVFLLSVSHTSHSVLNTVSEGKKGALKVDEYLIQAVKIQVKNCLFHAKEELLQ